MFGHSFQCYPRCQSEAAKGELRMLVAQRLPEACQNHPTKPQFLNWYLQSSNFSQYSQADCWQEPETSWRLPRLLENENRTKEQAPMAPSTSKASGFSRTGREQKPGNPTVTASKRPKLINGHSLKEMGNVLNTVTLS